MIERGQIDTPTTPKYDNSLFPLDTGTSIKSGVLSSFLNEMDSNFPS
jgi:hypothetical protein